MLGYFNLKSLFFPLPSLSTLAHSLTEKSKKKRETTSTICLKAKKKTYVTN